MVPFTVAFKRRHRLIAQQGTARPLQGIVVQCRDPASFSPAQSAVARESRGSRRNCRCAAGDAIADRIDLIEKMGDEDQTDAVILSWRIRVNSISTSRVSRLAVGSSRISTLADRSMARQIATICCIATEKRFSGSRTSRESRRRPSAPSPAPPSLCVAAGQTAAAHGR